MSDTRQSQAMLHPIIEDDILTCPHGGKVQLKSIKGRCFKSDGVPLILESDMQNSLIFGCSNTILGVSVPCTMVVNIPSVALSLKKLNGERAVMQDYASIILTDKGFPLQIIPKPNKWKLLASVPQSSGNEKDRKESSKDLFEHIFHIRYCLSNYCYSILDNTYKAYIYNSSVENINAEVKEVEFHSSDCDNIINVPVGKDNKSDIGIYPPLLDYLRAMYTEKVYSYKAISIDIGYDIFEYIFLGLNKARYVSSFGYCMTGTKFMRTDNKRENGTNKPIITEIVKTSLKLESINIMIS